MITDTLFHALERRGGDRYALAPWRAGVLSRHHQAVLQALVILVVLVLVLLFSVPVASAQGDQPQAMACAEKHQAAAKDVLELRKIVAAAQTSSDIAILRTALDATMRHLDAMDAKALKCADMMKQHMVKPLATKEPASPQAPEKHAH